MLLPNIVDFKDSTVRRPTELDILVRSYQATITSYNNALYGFLGVLSLIGIGTFFLNKSGAEKVDREYEKAEKKTEKYEKYLQMKLAGIDATVKKAIEDIQYEANRERKISQLLADAYDEYLKGSYEDAIKCYDKVIEINPEDDKAYNNKGIALANLGKYEDATEEYNKAIEINPEDDTAYYNKGNALANLGKYEDAIEEYNKAIKINSENPQYYNLACAYAQWNKSDTDLDSKPENCLELCKENLIKAKESGDFKQLGIKHIKNDSDFDSIKNYEWFNDIMCEEFGDEWDKYDEDNSSIPDKAE